MNYLKSKFVTLNRSSHSNASQTEVDHDANYEDDLDALEISVDPQLRFRSDDDLGLRFGLEPAKSPAPKLCRNALILSLLSAVANDYDGIFYSRNRNSYGKKTANPHYFTYTHVLWSVASLVTQPRYFQHTQQKPKRPSDVTRPTRRSSISPGPDLLKLNTTELFGVQPSGPTDRIEVRDRHKRPMPVKMTSEIRATQEFLLRYDTAVGALKITLDYPKASLIAPGTYLVESENGPIRVDTRRRSLVRIFNLTQNSGGRFYRAFWQTMRKWLRPHLRIDGENVFEHDFESCHVKLLYFAARIAWPFGLGDRADAYMLPNVSHSRKLVKRATNTLWNTRSFREAEGAIARLLTDENFEFNRADASRLIQAIKQHHPGLNGFFHSNYGKALQFVDSKILWLCLEQLLAEGIVGLPNHDSIVVAASHQAKLRQIMEEIFETEGAKLAQARLVRKRSRTEIYDRHLTIGREGADGGVVDGRMNAPAFPLSSAAGSRYDPPPLDCVSAAEVEFLDPHAHHPFSLTSRNQGATDRTAQSTDQSPEAAVIEIRALIAHRLRWSSGVVRCLLIFAWMKTRSIDAAVDALHRDCADIGQVTGVAVPTAITQAEIQRFRERAHSPIRLASAAKLCGVSKREAEALGLQALRPVGRRTSRSNDQAERRRAKSWNRGILPRLVNIGIAKPWLKDGLRQTRWRELHQSPIKLQKLALLALIEQDDQKSVGAVREKLEDIKRIRQVNCVNTRLAIDDLIKELDDALFNVTTDVPD